MRKVIIIGCPGSGKSYFATRLSEKTGLPLHHLDLIWHKADRTTLSRDEFDAKLSEIMQSDAWIIDGNYSRTLEMRFKECDTVFLLDFPTDVCIDGAKSRVGIKQPSLPWVEESLDEEFGEFIRSFRERQLLKIYSFIDEYNDKINVVIFKSRDDINIYLK